MKKGLFAFAAAAAVLAGCQISDDFSIKPGAKEGRSPLSFTASIESPDTRAALVAGDNIYRPVWQVGDRIAVNGYVGTMEGMDIYSAVEGGSTYTSIQFFQGDTLTSGPFEAYSPINAQFGFPGAQTMEGSVLRNVPMRAANDTTNLVFKNLGGLLKLNIKTAESGIVVKRVVITTDQPMAGKYALDGDAAVIAADGSKSISVDCGDGVAIGADAVPFYVAIPANTYTGMTIQLIADGGKKSNILKMKSGASFTVERSKYYEAEFSFEKFETSTTGGVAILPTGPDFNSALKQQSQCDDLATYSTIDQVITRIVFDTNSANDEGVNIADLSSENPVYLSVDPSSGVAYVSTPASEFKLPADASYMFSNMSNLVDIINLKSINTEDVEDMSYMFYFNGCPYQSLKSIDLSNFNTSNVFTMRSMFNGCSQLTELDVSTFDTGNVEEMAYMFQHCEKIKTLDVSNFDVENNSTLEYTFGYCYELESLMGVKDWNTENCNNFRGTFGYCYAITELDLEGWDTSNGQYVCNTFWHCHSLLKINIPNFNFTSATDVRSLFNRCDALQVIDVSMLDPMNSGLGTSTTYTGYFFYRDCSLKEIIANDTFMFPNRSSYFMCANNSPYEYRPGSVAGSLTIKCDQDIADWFATTGLRWIANGYNADPIPVHFIDYMSGMELSVTWSAN